MILKYKVITLLSFLVYCKCILAAVGEIDENCTINCACCKNRNCGPNEYYSEGYCFDGCIDGYRGARCYRKCTYNCPKCVGDADICESCYDGFYLEVTKDCSGVCPSECVSCTSPTVCTKCKEHFYNDHGSKDCRYHKCPVNCKCDQNGCVECQAGYFGPSTTCIDTCPSNCNTCLSKDFCQSCKAGYYNGKELDSPQNPVMNNCVHQCRAECTSCLSFNNCTSCMPGTFGPTCQQKCSTGCNNNVCEKETGNCICRQNFAGTDCTKCILGKFGDSCEKKCSYYCKNGICDKKSGECNECISENMIGQRCDTCKDGWYGDSCEKSCSIYCKNGICDKKSGECNECISENMISQRCDTCKDGWYGDRCNLRCPTYCKDSLCYNELCNSSCAPDCKETLIKDIEKCDRKTGHCLFGCTVGYFGGDCKASCSRLCIDNVCEQNTGRCSKGCDSQSSEPECQIFTEHQTDKNKNNNNQTAVIVMGIIIAILVVSLAVSLILLWRARFFQNNTVDKTISPENNTKEAGDKHITSKTNPVCYNVMETGSNSNSTKETDKTEYEKINNLPVSEHEYGHITVGV